MGPQPDLRAAEAPSTLILLPFGSFDFNWALALEMWFRTIGHHSITVSSYEDAAGH
jgi:hypothetical protein